MTHFLSTRGSNKPLYSKVLMSASLGTSGRVEQHTRRLEMDFGRERLLRTVLNVDARDISEHVAHYRTVIRTGMWPNENRPTSLPEFCDEYERAAIAYVMVGFDALDYFSGGLVWTSADIYRRVLASEALRGQFGKRSPTGLDKRLEKLVDELEVETQKVFPADEVHEKVHLLCVPTEMSLSAEAALLEDFATLSQSFPTPPSIDDVLSAGVKDQEIAWTFLRRHARWSISAMARYYTDFNIEDFKLWVDRARDERKSIAVQRSVLVDQVIRFCCSETAEKVLILASQIRTLNELNLTLEPYFSFKGGPGLPQGLVFKQAPTIGLDTQISIDELRHDKWSLFQSAAV